MKAPEELLFEIDQLRIKYKGQKFDIEKGSSYINESIDLINQFKEEVEKNRCEKCRHSFEDKDKPSPHHDVEEYYSTE